MGKDLFINATKSPPPGWVAEDIGWTRNLAEWDRIAFSMSSIPPTAEDNSTVRERSIKQLRSVLDWAAVGRTVVFIADAVREKVLADQRVHPLSKVAFEFRQGSSVDLVNIALPPAPLKASLAQVRYNFILRSELGEPFFEVRQSLRGDPQAVAMHIPMQKGHIVIAPPIELRSTNELKDYLEVLLQVPAALAGIPSPVPNWANTYCSTVERKQLAEVRECEKQTAMIALRLTLANAQLEARAWMKRLYFATGDEFLATAQRALSELGFRVARVPGVRTDLLARDGANLLVIETKGLTGPAKAADLAQVNRWVADMRAALLAESADRAADPHLSQCEIALGEVGVNLAQKEEVTVKGALLIGTFRDIPLEDRRERDFSDDLLREVRRSEVCALSGLQLLAQVLTAENDAASASQFRAKILTTNGLLETPEWQTLLQPTSVIDDA